MSQIATLAAAPAITIIQGQSQADQYILIGDASTAMPLTAITVEIDGKPFLLIQTAELLAAFAKWQMESNLDAAPTVGVMLKIATGQIAKNTTYRLTNGGATTPAVYAFSEAQNGVPLEAASMTINATSNEVYERFSALFFFDPADLASLEITFADGHTDSLSAVEAAALFNMRFNAEDSGYLAGCLVIDNTDGSIQKVRAYTGASDVAVLTVKIPDAAFNEFKKALR